MILKILTSSKIKQQQAAHWCRSNS